MAGLQLYGPDGERVRRRVVVVACLVLVAGALAALGARAGAGPCRTDLDLVVGGESTSVARDAAAEGNSDRFFFYVVAADFELAEGGSVLANAAGLGQHLVGLELRGRVGHPVAPGDRFTTDGSGASFSLLTQVDERFSSFSPIDAASRVEVLAVSRRSLCLRVRFADQRMEVEGTIRAPIRDQAVRGVRTGAAVSTTMRG
ncbi:hypothetical protein [Nocardioides marmoribigeumensis]|uniref:Uncharacterized protein n=1 Tax=Nocardioides marmoribigeumensis TaxID=433649 RepID=A0ABU2BRU7_9ACTN|nr:hypothetical protein [Nocardioides marmoribigeumensis]MDR7361338.1 hypothetical protein [Nocardioides marmoribigeumensis]